MSVAFDLVQQKKKKTIKALVELGFKEIFMGVENVTSSFPLMWACQARDIGVIKVLIEVAKVTLNKA